MPGRIKSWLHDCIGVAGDAPVDLDSSTHVCPMCGTKKP